MRDLLALVEDFRQHASRRRWNRAEHAKGSCDTAAREFQSFASNAHVRTDVFHLQDPTDVTRLARHLGMKENQLRSDLREEIADLERQGMSACNVHEVSVVNLDNSKVTIDWTARQYNQRLPFPLMRLKPK